MRMANVDGRLSLIVEAGFIDVEKASEGQFDSAPAQIYGRWQEFREWAATAPVADPMPLTTLDRLGPPSPAPAQIFAIGLNYSEHAKESGFAKPDAYPPVFTKYVTSLAGPCGTVRLPEGGHTDWEVELVAVIGQRAFDVDEADAWDHVAGLTLGQDLSERILQSAATPPQFSLGKSYPGFGPTGPWLVTTDEFDNRDDIGLRCSINGEEVQKGRTSDLIFSVPQLVAQLSRVLPLQPGDLVFTGTPSGVGLGRSPQRFLRSGDELISHAESIGELRQRFVDGD
jgi:2-keto-4-pentenoate hydratase/2-oxohepta-3-ene-1,7-dioic acid hydratase in catechol pathway